MAYSIIQYTATGLTNTYAINFALGFNNRNEVTCQVNNEVDGLGDPVYRTLTWINDGLVTVDGALLTAGWPVVFKRTVSKTALIHDYSNGEAIEESNLDESNKQNLMAIHEVLDGRFSSAFQQDLDMNLHKIINVANGINPKDAVNFGQLNGLSGGAGNGLYLDVTGTQAQEDVLLWDVASLKFIRRSLIYLKNLISSAYAQTLLVAANASAARTTLGLGTAATANIGTSGANVPLLNAVNTFGASQIVSQASTIPLVLENTNSGQTSLTQYKVAGVAVGHVGADASRCLSVYDNTGSNLRMAVTQAGMGAFIAGLTVGNTAQAGTGTLDWYEEGTFTPGLSSVGGTPTYTTQVGNYTRIGDTVRVNGTVTCSAWPGGSGQMSITGLPFSSNAANGYSSATVYLNNIIVGAGIVAQPLNAAGGSLITLNTYNQTTGVEGTIAFDTAFTVHFNLTYRV